MSMQKQHPSKKPVSNWVSEMETRAKKKAAKQKNRRNQGGNAPKNSPEAGQKNSSGTVWLFGRHAVFAALANPTRDFRRLLVTKNSGEHLPDLPQELHPQTVETQEINRVVPRDAVHQGYALEVLPLQEADLDILAHTERPILLLDQITDPHNIGAILRSAAAFDAAGIVLTKHGAPEETGTLAKSASGALELVPVVRVANLVQAMEQLKSAGYWVAGMDGSATQTLCEAKLSPKTALVMGAEGSGLRRLTQEKCDLLVKLPISSKMESLNVSNAAAIALYELNR
ncbi:MAG: 23S rRNA (guanosine(2251)-2'-O)-methyltransferase RlmB [Alphaproteobacteria bacterium]|nr:23S rRNA (guanosine(2251)-2'-O)-methyltransferase RlmB [Alphaproteobacteria bacterium]